MPEDVSDSYEVLPGPAAPRVGVRALILDPEERVLLVRFDLPWISLWATPGGGVKEGEDPIDALRRELLEETGLADFEVGPIIWTRHHRMRLRPVNQKETFYLVRCERFEPRPHLSWEELNREGMTGVRWWTLQELEAHSEVFAPARLPALVADIVDNGPPRTPFDAGV